MPLKKGKLSVATENILPIIKKWLYSQKEIFLRELVSNSFDAINKLKKVSLSEEIRDPKDTEYAVEIRIDRERKQILIEDNGIGMDAEEIGKYIANIAFSGAHDFIKKYEESGDKDKAGIIGNFGLGFYSSFMVASNVEVDSLSYRKDAKAALWSSTGGLEYEIGEGKRKKRGTSIRLTLNEDAHEFLDKTKITELVRHFVDFLPLSVRVDGAEANRRDPLWTQSPAKLKKEDYNAFYKYLYPFQGEPLFHIHLNVDYPFQLQGILFFPRLGHEMELNRSNVKIYCKQVFVSDEAQDLIPQYLTILQGVIDIPDLPLNVSRSYLQNEPKIKKIATHIVKKIADRLKEEQQKRIKDYEKIWPEISPFVKYAMMNDQSFYEQASSALLFQEAQDKEKEISFLTIEEYQNKYKDKTGDKIYYVSDMKSQANPLAMLSSQGIGVLVLNSLIDKHFIQFLETKIKDCRFIRVDSEISEHVIDKESASKILDAEGKDQKEELIKVFKDALANDKITFRVEALKDDKVPAMVLLPEQMRRFQEMSAMTPQGKEVFEFPLEHSLLLNSKNKIIQSLLRPTLIESSNPEKDSKQKLIARQVYYLARLAQGNISRVDIENTLETSYSLLACQI